MTRCSSKKVMRLETLGGDSPLTVESSGIVSSRPSCSIINPVKNTCEPPPCNYIGQVGYTGDFRRYVLLCRIVVEGHRVDRWPDGSNVKRCGKAVPATIAKCLHCDHPNPGKAALRAKKPAIIGGLIIFCCAGFCGLGWWIERDPQPREFGAGSSSGPLTYEVIKIERAMPGRPRSALRIHVRTEQLDAKNEIAAQLVRQHDDERMI